MNKNIVISFFLLLSVSSGSAQTRIGYVSPDEIFASMPETKKADTALAEYQEALAQTYKDQEEELNVAYAKFVKDSSKMTPAVKEAKRRDIQERISGLQGKQQQLNDALQVEKERQLRPIREKALAAIKAVAAEKGYNHILYKDQAIVFPEADDITELVKKKLGIK